MLSLQAEYETLHERALLYSPCRSPSVQRVSLEGRMPVRAVGHGRGSESWKGGRLLGMALSRLLSIHLFLLLPDHMAHKNKGLFICNQLTFLTCRTGFCKGNRSLVSCLGREGGCQPRCSRPPDVPKLLFWLISVMFTAGSTVPCYRVLGDCGQR